MSITCNSLQEPVLHISEISGRGMIKSQKIDIFMYDGFTICFHALLGASQQNLSDHVQSRLGIQLQFLKQPPLNWAIFWPFGTTNIRIPNKVLFKKHDCHILVLILFSPLSVSISKKNQYIQYKKIITDKNILIYPVGHVDLFAMRTKGKIKKYRGHQKLQVIFSFRKQESIKE